VPKTFGDLPARFSSPQNARASILPAPYDGTSTWIKGADRGPAAIIDASAHMELYDIETGTEVYKRGISTEPALDGTGTPEAMAERVRAAVGRLLDAGRLPVMLGGEHSVTIGAVQATAARFPGLSVLQLDAHTDLRPTFEGSTYNHACVMSRVRDVCPFVQVGIRSMDVEETAHLPEGKVFFAERLQGDTAWIDSVVAALTDTVYLTVDLDVFDPSLIPSTGTPEPGGMLWYPVLALLRRVCSARKVVAFDVVELCPSPANRGPDFAAAKLVYKILTYIFETSGAARPAR
jgi:agmatinase